MKILHIADVHLHDAGDRDEQTRCLAHLATVARDRAVDLVIIAGDLIDPAGARIAREWERNAWRTALRAFAKTADVVVVRGNHDVPGDFRHIGDIGRVMYADRPTLGVVGSATIVCVPWIDVALWAGDEGARLAGEGVPTGTAGTETAQLRATAFLRRCASPGAVAVFHGTYESPTLNVDGRKLPATANEVRLPADAFEGYALACLGHIHHPQQWEVGGTVIAYPGSPWAHDHGEEGVVGRGAILWTLEGGRVVGQEQIAVPAAERITGRIAWTGEGFAWQDGSPYEGVVDSNIIGLRPAGVAGKRVRLIVEYPKGVDFTEVGRLYAAIEAAGAKSVKIERRSWQDAPAKVPELAAQSHAAPLTLREQLQAVFDAGAIQTPDDATLAALDDMCAELTNAVGETGEHAAGVRRYLRFRCAHIGKWAGREVDIDLTDKAGLIRLAGKNGSGKSTIMAWLGPALGFGTDPNRGKASKYASTRNGWIEVEFEAGDGAAFKARVELSAKGERKGYLWRNGEAVEGIDGKITAFEAYLQRHVFGRLDRFLWTTYHAQRSAEISASGPTSFNEAGPTERGALFEHVLGLERFKAWQRASESRAAACKARIDALQPAAARVRSASEALATLREQMATARNAATTAVELLDAARKREAAARVAVTAAEEALAGLMQRERWAGELAEEQRTRQGVEAQIQAAETALADARAELARREAEEGEARAAVEAAKLAQAEPAAALQRRNDATETLRRAEGERAGIDRQLADLRKRHADTLATRTEASRAIEAADVAIREAEQALGAEGVERLKEAAAAAEAEHTPKKAAVEVILAEHAQQERAVGAAKEAASAVREAHGSARGARQVAHAKRRNGIEQARHTIVSTETAESAARQAKESLSDVGCAGQGPNGGWLPCRLIDRTAAQADTLQRCIEATASARATVTALEDAHAQAEAADAATAKAEAEELAAAEGAVRAATEALAEIVTRGKAARDVEVEAAKAADAAKAALAEAVERQKATAVAVEHQKAARHAAELRLAGASTTELDASIVDATQRRDAAAEAVDAATRLRNSIVVDETALQAVAAAEAKAAQCATATATARATVTARDREVGALQGRLGTLRAAADIAADITAHNVTPDAMDAAREALSGARAAAFEAESAIGSAGAAAASAQTAVDRLTGEEAALERTVAAGEEELAELEREEVVHKRWAQLAEWIRRLATLTVDASRASVEAKVNEFLHSCFGDRFRMRLEPETENKTTAGVSKTYDVYVTDSEAVDAVERTLETYSGGEQNPVRQAIQYGLLLYSNEQTPSRWGVAWVDEADVGLDPAAQLRWQSMLARFVELGGMRQVFVVTHGGLEVATCTIDVGELGTAEVVDIATRRKRAPKAVSEAPAPDAAEIAEAAQGGLPF